LRLDYQQTTNNKQQHTTTNNNEQQQTTNNKHQTTNNKQQTTTNNSKQHTTNNKQQTTTTNKKQHTTTNNKQQTTNNNKQHTTNNKQQQTTLVAYANTLSNITYVKLIFLVVAVQEDVKQYQSHGVVFYCCERTPLSMLHIPAGYVVVEKSSLVGVGGQCFGARKSFFAGTSRSCINFSAAQGIFETENRPFHSKMKQILPLMQAQAEAAEAAAGAL
jgi:hypothetical protein